MGRYYILRIYFIFWLSRTLNCRKQWPKKQKTWYHFHALYSQQISSHIYIRHYILCKIMSVLCVSYVLRILYYILCILCNCYVQSVPLVAQPCMWWNDTLHVLYILYCIRIYCDEMTHYISCIYIAYFV